MIHHNWLVHHLHILAVFWQRHAMFLRSMTIVDDWSQLQLHLGPILHTDQRFAAFLSSMAMIRLAKLIINKSPDFWDICGKMVRSDFDSRLKLKWSHTSWTIALELLDYLVCVSSLIVTMLFAGIHPFYRHPLHLYACSAFEASP